MSKTLIHLLEQIEIFAYVISCNKNDLFVHHDNFPHLVTSFSNITYLLDSRNLLNVVEYLGEGRGTYNNDVFLILTIQVVKFMHHSPKTIISFHYSKANPLRCSMITPS